MNNFQKIGIEPGLAICYSGYRKGQKPGNTIPTYEQVKEDLTLITKYWKYIRLYDCDAHSKTVLEVIRNEAFDLQVMLGAFIEAEANNFNCPWGGGIYSKPDLEENAERNLKKIDRLIEMGIQYSDIVFALSVGNEACVDWTDHMVPEQKVLDYVKRVKERTNIPVTFCENYVPWLNKLEELAAELDFISIHTYPVWEYKSIQAGLDYTKENYYAVAEKYPDKSVVISEAGWTTRSNGQGIDPLQVNEENQKRYFEELTEWTIKEGIPTFFFEAFDEDWKGSDDPSEPEKHWGIFKIDRTPKLALQET